MQFVKSHNGQTMIEYALLVVVIALVAIVGFKAIGVTANQKAADISSQLTGGP